LTRDHFTHGITEILSLNNFVEEFKVDIFEFLHGLAVVISNGSFNGSIQALDDSKAHAVDHHGAQTNTSKQLGVV